MEENIIKMAKMQLTGGAGSSSSSSSSLKPGGIANFLRGKASPACRRLLKAQHEELPRILQEIESSGAQNYVKRTHWAWYVWPTSKEGFSDPLNTAVKSPDDITHLLAAPTVSQWVAILNLLSEALRARQSRRVFPSIDHGRIEFFVKEWESAEYREHMRQRPDFAAAVDQFSSAWRRATG